jgi:Ca-activated chloride channel family protein
MGIKVYTIGVGRNGTAPTPQRNYFGGIDYVPMPVVIDEMHIRLKFRNR